MSTRASAAARCKVITEFAGGVRGLDPVKSRIEARSSVYVQSVRIVISPSFVRFRRAVPDPLEAAKGIKGTGRRAGFSRATNFSTMRGFSRRGMTSGRRRISGRGRKRRYQIATVKRNTGSAELATTPSASLAYAEDFLPITAGALTTFHLGCAIC